MSLSGLLNQTISLYNATGLDKFGRESVGSIVAVKARIEVKTITRILPNKETAIIEAVAYVPSGTTVSRGSKVVYDSNTYKVFSISTAVDGSGTAHHKRLELTKWQV